MDISTYEDRSDLAHAAADIITARASEGPMTLGLAGGSTPADVYDALVHRPIDWDTVSLWLSDERWVPHDHEDSNGRMALEHLPPAAHQRLVRPRYSPYLDPIDSAAHYEAELRSMHGNKPPDIIMLGVGTDGHTASLFPDTDALHADAHRWFVANHVPQLDSWRLTVTPSFLAMARRILVLVCGQPKAEILAKVVESPDDRYPIHILRRSQGEVTVLCDQAAAGELSD
jgi:6-phosphogluconolactonase